MAAKPARRPSPKHPTWLQDEGDRVLREQEEITEALIAVRHVEVGHLLIQPTAERLPRHIQGSSSLPSGR